MNFKNHKSKRIFLLAFSILVLITVICVKVSATNAKAPIYPGHRTITTYGYILRNNKDVKIIYEKEN